MSALHHTQSPSFVRSLSVLVLASIAFNAGAQMATTPLLTRSTAVYPNLVFMYDDSASMPGAGVYQFGGATGVYGQTGPGASSGSSLTTNTYVSQSPSVNLIYYNPKITYKMRVDANGNDIATSTLSNSTSFKVYFYKKAGASTSTSTYDGTGNDPTASGSYFATGSPAGYQPTGTELASGASTSTRYPNTASSSVSTYPKWVGRTDCVSATTTCSWAEELRNYSVWKAYHSDRDRLSKTGIGLAFKSIGPTLRLGWGKINTLDGGNLDSGVALFDQTTKSNFYSWLYGINSNVAGTPNRLALDTVGKYYSRSDSDGPWGTTPRVASTGSTTLSSPVSTENKANHLSCRRSFAMLMTDGYYNDSNPSVGGNVDNANGPIISSPTGATYQYKPSTAPLYKDSNSSSFADVAMKYWVNDLRADLENRVPASSTNESFWQNMTFYAIGLGVYGTLPQTTTTINNIKSGATSWPTIATNDPKAIDDMWHATLNARGAIYTATDSQTLNDGIDSMMSSINKMTSTQSGVAVSTASLKTGTRKYTPQYTTVTWQGNTVARNLDPITGNESSTAWQVQDSDSVGNIYAGIPAYGSRNIVVGTAATSGARAVNFTLSAMTSASLIGDMPASARTSAMIDYLRGDATNETEAGGMRVRPNRLGDIVNSSPVFVQSSPVREVTDPLVASSKRVMEIAATTNPLPGTGTSYTSYMTTLGARTEGVLLVGANDGMLHAFRDGTAGTPSDGGKEVFAYVPRSALARMDKLANPYYAHQYLVDGPNTENDGYWGSAWHQVLLGTTGAGGKTVYALDVSSPLAMGSSNVLWEVNNSTTGFSNLGYVLSDVQSGPLQDNTFAAVFGNGYESTSGIASLMVVNMQTGALIRELQVPTATGGPWSATVASVTTTYKNGLGGVKLVRDTLEQRIVGAYAGDLRGNLWRFDLSSSNPAAWTVTQAYSTGTVAPSTTVPTGNPQPITAAPQWIPHPTAGRIVVFGTGKFYQDIDVPAPYSTQTMYGIWDKTSFGTSPGTNLPIVKSSLDQRVLSTLAVDSTFLQLTDTAGNAPGVINWTTKSGWYFDLPFTGQRLVYPMEKLLNRNSRALVVDTISPANVSTNACVQSGSGASWVMFIDGLYGADPGRAPDISASNYTSVLMVPSSTSSFAMGAASSADGRNTTLKVDSSSTSSKNTVKMVTLSGGNASGLQSDISCILLGTCAPPPDCTTNPTDPSCSPPPPDCTIIPTPAGCSSTPPKIIKTREWRQIFMR